MRRAAVEVREKVVGMLTALVGQENANPQGGYQSTYDLPATVTLAYDFLADV